MHIYIYCTDTKVVVSNCIDMYYNGDNRVVINLLVSLTKV